jgi:hypothetical protein
MAGPRRLPASFGAEIEKPFSLSVLQLCEEKATPVSEVRVVSPELMAVVAQGERLLETSLEWPETTEMIDPLLIRQSAEANPFCPALVAIAQNVLRKARRLNDVVEIGPEFLMAL